VEFHGGDASALAVDGKGRLSGRGWEQENAETLLAELWAKLLDEL
jgi:hypothetical protein